MVVPVSSITETIYDILIEDADGRHLWLESARHLDTARERLSVLAAQYLGMRLILRNHSTRDILAQTDGY